MSHFTGPLLNVDKSRGDREWFSKLPIGQEPDYHVWMSDFDKTIDTTNEYTIVKDSGATVAIGTDAAQGTCVITSTATTENDGGLLMSIQESWKLASAKPLWFECKAKCNDVDQTDLFFGLAKQVATNPENTLTDADRIGFQVADGDASVLYVGELDGAGNTGTDSSVDMADDTYMTFGFYWDGVNKVKYFLNRALVASESTAANIPQDEELAIALFSLSGSATGTRATTIDYVRVVQKR
jgi:hypothetical protein